MEVRRTNSRGLEQAVESAQRCLQGALAQRDMKTAASLLRAAARYVERIGDERGDTFAEVIAFPSLIAAGR